MGPARRRRSMQRMDGVLSRLGPWRFALAWILPLGVAVAAWHSGWAALAVMWGVQGGLALAERVPGWRHSPPAAPAGPEHRLVLLGHVGLQAGLMAWALGLAATRGLAGPELLALALAVGGVAGSQGITFAHELGHSRHRGDRWAAWALMASVLYAHFMVEHYRGHHVRAATHDDPATARRGESLWRFLPRTLAGSWRSAWALERQQLARLGRSWARSPLAWGMAAQAGLLALAAAAAGGAGLLLWAVQAAYAVFLLESINYIEHYGLQRQEQATPAGPRAEPFGVMHAWNADHALTNCFIANLQRHSDHHMHAWKPYATLEPLPGPQLPTGYAGCLFLASVPPLWFRVMHPRLRALAAA
jgi:alkane 1-monooxygenase